MPLCTMATAKKKKNVKKTKADEGYSNTTVCWILSFMDFQHTFQYRNETMNERTRKKN